MLIVVVFHLLIISIKLSLIRILIYLNIDYRWPILPSHRSGTLLDLLVRRCYLRLNILRLLHLNIQI